MTKSKYSDVLITATLEQSESGVPVTDLCREHIDTDSYLLRQFSNWIPAHRELVYP